MGTILGLWKESDEGSSFARLNCRGWADVKENMRPEIMWKEELCEIIWEKMHE